MASRSTTGGSRRARRTPLGPIALGLCALVVLSLGVVANLRREEPSPDASESERTTTTVPDGPDDSGLVVGMRDEFTGSRLSTDRWKADHITPSRTPGEQSCASPKNVSVKGGTLILRATAQPTRCPKKTTMPYGGATVRTRGTFSSAYGNFGFRVKLPKGAGIRSTISLLPVDELYGKSGRSGEITVLDADGGHPNRMNVAASWAEPGCGDGCSSETQRVPLPPSSDGFHRVELQWSPARLRWFLDGKEVFRLGEPGPTRWGSSADRLPPEGTPPLYPAPFDGTNPMYVVLSVSVGDPWVGSPESPDEFPQSFEIDWVRIRKPEPDAAG